MARERAEARCELNLKNGQMSFIEKRQVIDLGLLAIVIVDVSALS
jgi:hypothetical protein